MKHIRRLAVPAMLIAALVVAPIASAHVTVNPREAENGAFTRLTVRVPTEKADASTTAVTLQIPEGVDFVSFQPKPGWTRTVTMEKLTQPTTNEGQTVTERIATVTWKGGRIAPGEFDEFGISLRMPESGTEITFPAVQTYSDGEVVRWIGSADADEPAPRVTLAPAGAEGEPTATPAATPAAAEDGDDSGRANVALGLGIAGLVVGLCALGVAAASRRKAS